MRELIEHHTHGVRLTCARGEGRRDGLWDVLDSLTNQPTMTMKMEPGIGVTATVIAPKELTYLGL